MARNEQYIHYLADRTRLIRGRPAGTSLFPAPARPDRRHHRSRESGIVNVILAYLVACRDVVIWAVDMIGGMELRPWATCIQLLAFTPEQATELFRDAVTEVNRRAAKMAETGK